MPPATRFAIRSPLRKLGALLLASVIVASTACKPTAAGGPVDRAAKKRDRSARRGVGARRQAAVAARTGGSLAAGYANAPRGTRGELLPREGYIVKGTDLLTFWPCGENDYFYVRTPQGIAVRIAQQYKFQSPRFYSPMFAQVKLREVSDTITVGAVEFTRVAEIMDFTPSERPATGCKAPTRAVLAKALDPIVLQQFAR